MNNHRRGDVPIYAIILVLLVLGFLLLVAGSAFHQWTTRHWGGAETMAIPPGYTLVNATWKDSNLWILVREEKTGKMVFQERSMFGVLQGSVTFTETK